MKFAVFFMGEYATMMAFSGVFAVMFLGGWSPLPLNWEYLASQATASGLTWLSTTIAFISGPVLAPFWFIAKLVTGLTFYIWLRATLPRLRYDQLMDLGWKALLPIAALNFVVVAIWMQFGWWALAGSIVVIVLLYFYFVTAYLKPKSEMQKREIIMVHDPVIDRRM